MTDHEYQFGDDRVDGESDRRLSPPEVLATLADGTPTEGDIRMLMELRVGLRAHPAGPATVVGDPATMRDRRA